MRNPIFILLSLACCSVGLTACSYADDGTLPKTMVMQKALDEYSGQDSSNQSAPDTQPAAAQSPAAPTVSSTPKEVIVTPAVTPIVPEAQVPAAIAAPAEAASTTPSGEIVSDDTIDVLDLKDVDVSDVLKLISKKTGLNIIANQDVRGRITIYLKDVKIKDALRIILDSNNLAYKLEDGIVRVMPAKEFEDRYGYKFGGKIKNLVIHLDYANVADITAVLTQIKSNSGKIVADPKSNTLLLMDSPEKLEVMRNLVKGIDVPTMTEVFELNYALAKTVAEKVTEVLSKDTGRIKFDERSNKIVVTDTPFKIKEIEKVIKAFDIKETQVLIEAKIIQVKLDKETQFGINWEGLLNRYHSLDLKSSFKELPTGSNGGSLNVGTVDSDQYSVLLEALEKVEDSTILSSPSITTLNNQEAKILVGTTQPYVTSTTTTPSSGPSTTAESVNFIDVGVKLYVTPVIHKDGFITMKIRPEVSSAGTFLTTSDTNQIPIVDTSQAETTVVVRNGVTIIIGGLIKDEKFRQLQRVPVLGTLPLIGAAFRNSDVHPVKTEIVIFLTPKIITGDVSIDPLAAHHMIKDMTRQHDLDRELNEIK